MSGMLGLSLRLGSGKARNEEDSWHQADIRNSRLTTGESQGMWRIVGVRTRVSVMNAFIKLERQPLFSACKTRGRSRA
jgi:hypothetical protein